MQDQKAPNDLFNRYNIDSLIKKKIRPTDLISFWHETVNISLNAFA